MVVKSASILIVRPCGGGGAVGYSDASRFFGHNGLEAGDRLEMRYAWRPFE